MLHKLNLSTGAFNFAANPVILNASAPTSFNISATGYGRAIGNSGTRIWDTNITPAISTQLVSNSAPFTFPLSNTNLPPYLFDAIITTQVNGDLLPLGFSNSPDNDGIYSSSQPPINKTLFWTDLRCFAAGNNFGDSNGNNNYLFGGDSKQADGPQVIKVYFNTALLENISINYSITYHSYANGQTGLTFNGTVPLMAGQNQYNLATLNLILLNYNAGFGLLFNQTGYFKISLSTTNIAYRSLLPFYHWGVN